MMVFESEDAARGAAQMVESNAPQNEGVKLDGVQVREVVANG